MGFKSAFKRLKRKGRVGIAREARNHFEKEDGS